MPIGEGGKALMGHVLLVSSVPGGPGGLLIGSLTCLLSHLCSLGFFHFSPPHLSVVHHPWFYSCVREGQEDKLMCPHASGQLGEGLCRKERAWVPPVFPVLGRPR